MQLLLHITQVLVSEIEPERTHAAVLSAIRDVTGAARVSLQVLDSAGPEDVTGRLVLTAGIGLPAHAQLGEHQPADAGIAGWVLRHRQPLLLNGDRHDDPEIERLMRAVPGLSAICVPLIAKEEPIGVLNASKPMASGPFDDYDRDFLAVLAGQAAIALAHARLYARIAQQATIDGLTGLLNHAAFQTRLAAELERARRIGQELALLMIDLDGFKQVNDIYGHPAGDRLLTLLARRAIQAHIRPYDIACRPGGDEFAVVLGHATAERAVQVAERIRHAVATCDTTQIGVPTGSVAASIGVAHFPTDGMQREDLIERADNALYFAKYLGRNRVERASSAAVSLERDPERLQRLLQQADTYSLEALAAAIDGRDLYTAGHSRRVAQYATALAQALGYRERFCYRLRLACLFHDIGKIGVPESVLHKPGRLSESEFARMREHPTTGAKMLAHVPALRRAVDAIRHHHERWDGKGYPDGLAAEQIPPMARMIAIADAYDAMTSDRVHRDALLDEDIIRAFQAGAGYQWDASMVAVWIDLLQRQDRAPSIPASGDLAP